MTTLFDKNLTKALQEDKKYLEQTAVPILSVSAAYKEDVKDWHQLPNNETANDIVFSRAHYSMAVGVATQAWGKKLDYKKAWLVDPTNYVSHNDWFSIQLTEKIGKTIARRPILKTIKDIIDTFGRNKLPILDSITPPLLYLTENIEKPILSLHVAVANILIPQGKKVVQVVTDPHVRSDYLTHADNKNLTYCVFNAQTKVELLEQAAFMHKRVDPDRVIVTGPPIDPRIIAARKSKQPWRSGPLHLCITTGGLGTNLDEIELLLRTLLPLVGKKSSDLKLLIYCGTHLDIKQQVEQLATQYQIKIGSPGNERSKLRVLHHPQIVNANELLIEHAFPWAHGFITKPSGDMAYDAVAAGCFLLTLAEWGEWEHNIKEIFEQKQIARELNEKHAPAQLKVLTSAQGKAQSWIEQAMLKAHTIDPLFLKGAENILKAYEKVAKN